MTEVEIERHPLEVGSEAVARLTRPEREYRVHALVERSHALLAEGIEVLSGGREIVATAILYSGGNDSTTVGHIFKGVATHAVHANTGIGIEETRQFVRDTCAGWGLPLVEKHAGTAFEDFVMANGFPGPAQHYRMYQRLKERCLDAARVDLGCHRSRKKRAIFIAGRRRDESARRADVPKYEPDGSVIWISPLVEWTKLDLNTYRLMHDDVPLNPVSQNLEMSGECLCSSFAKPGEIEMIGDFYPHVREEVEALERRLQAACDTDPVLAAKIPAARRLYGWGAYENKARPARRTGRLCASCVAPEPTDGVNPRLTAGAIPA